ncbi:alpha/beta hydrolase [Streptomyces sp. ID05-26A]|nr:alpha/beta hydrolase [Streptomyces sp. ID05-26A]
MRKTLLMSLVVSVMGAGVLPVAATPVPPRTLSWSPCPEDVGAPGLECSTLQVPLNYYDPNGRKIEIAVSRLASKNPAQRRGVLLTNPGGPGASPALDFPFGLKEAGLPQSVLDAYDVIGFDPRGVGRSTPVTCGLTPEQTKYGPHPSYADNGADVAKQASVAEAIARQCAGSAQAWMLPHTTTANTARDMDRIRQALGEEKISYLGYSYGTHLGAVFTTLFPHHSDRIVLDSNLVPTGFDATAVRLMAKGLEDRFPDFADFVAAHPEYGLGATSAEVRAKYFALAARLDKAPFQGVDGSLFRWVTLAFLYNDAQLPALAEVWKAIDTNQPPPPVNDPTMSLDNAISSHLAVACADTRWPRSIHTYQRNVEVDRIRHPLIGAASASIRPCAYWQTDPVEPPVRVRDRGPSNVLLVQYTRDPGTPLVGARQMRQALGDRARMVTVDGGGHGVYLFGTNKCANSAATAFLATGKRPAHDLACAAEPN